MNFENQEFNSSSEPAEAELSPEELEYNERKEQRLFLSALKCGNMDVVTGIAHAMSFSEDFLKSGEVQEAVKEGVLIAARRGDDNSITSLGVFLNDSEKEFFHSKEAQEAAKEGFIHKMSRQSLVLRDLEDLHWFALKFDIEESPEIQQSIKEKLIAYVNEGSVEKVEAVKQIFNLEFDVVSEAQGVLLDAAREGNLDRMYNIKNIVSSEFLRSDDFKEALMGGIKKQLDEGRWDDISEAIVSFNIPKEQLRTYELKMAAVEAIEKEGKNKSEGDINYIRETFGLSLAGTIL